MKVTMMTSAYAMLGGYKLHGVVSSYHNENSLRSAAPSRQKVYVVGMLIFVSLSAPKGMDLPLR